MRQVGVGPHRLGEAEVGDLGRAIRPEQDVGGLQITMNDSLSVGIGNGPRARFRSAGGPLGGPGGAVESLRQTSPFEILELEIRPLVVVAEAVNLDDVGMAQFALRSRLPKGSELRPRDRRALPPGSS